LVADEGDSPEGHGLLEQKKEFLESFFEKGAQLTRDLLRENERLRHRIVELEEQLRAGGSASHDELRQIDRALAQRYAEIERENNALASLFVAQSQLHASLHFDQVVEVILEILLNFVGARDFTLIERTGDTERVIATHGQVADTVGQHPTVRAALDHGAHRVVGVEAGAAPLVCYPLRVDGGVGGAFVITSFLPQKHTLEDVDHRMFDLISDSGGLALQAARCYEAIKAR
jgi:nitrate/nitrite-specific signal transduction histidine kinase